MRIHLLSPTVGDRAIRDATYRMLAAGLLPDDDDFVERWLADRGVDAIVLSDTQAYYYDSAVILSLWENYHA